MNVTTAGNLVNIRTGIVNTTVTGTVYSDNQLAVYQVDKVLLPLSFFVSISPAPAPSKPVKKAPFPVSDESASSTDASVQASGDVPHRALNVAVCFAGLVIGYKPKVKAALGLRAVCASFSTESSGDGSGGDVVGGGGDNNNNSSMSFAEAKKLMRLVNVEALKMKLGGEDW